MRWSRLMGLQDRTASGSDSAAASAPPGQIYYAIGDIHGRLDLLWSLLKKIDADAAHTPSKAINLVFLGDYVDRGKQSRGVVELLSLLKRKGGDRVTTLKGNHEEALLGFLADPSSGAAWGEHGGRETLVSYGVEPAARTGPTTTAWIARRATPSAQRHARPPIWICF